MFFKNEPMDTLLHTYSCTIIHMHHLLSGFLPSHNFKFSILYTCDSFLNVNATRGNISVSKYTHDSYFSVQISHYAFGSFLQSWRWEG
jgi:hypothetical protein